MLTEEEIAYEESHKKLTRKTECLILVPLFVVLTPSSMMTAENSAFDVIRSDCRARVCVVK